MRQDYLGICNEMGLPAREFQADFCSRCVQKECSRSLVGRSRFDERVRTWEERLFHNRPIMPDSDPRLVVLQGRRFVELDARPLSETGKTAWRDPRELDGSVESPQASSSVVVTVPDTVTTEPVKLAEPVKQTDPRPPLTQPLNTPNQAGRVIGGYKPQQERDAWAAPTPPTVQVVRPGARIKMG